jgi:hypothetical protein
MRELLHQLLEEGQRCPDRAGRVDGGRGRRRGRKRWTVEEEPAYGGRGPAAARSPLPCPRLFSRPIVCACLLLFPRPSPTSGDSAPSSDESGIAGRSAGSWPHQVRSNGRSAVAGLACGPTARGRSARSGFYRCLFGRRALRSSGGQAKARPSTAACRRASHHKPRDPVSKLSHFLS